ncbi:monofunctional biosynthetic peptidoglycan transglycosylase [Rheinheimera sp. F8]|uniref:monofunctional biosynthetic peptidoglycan transglycosylase n=1 Tax=Rheinheimera sp. F8 TaxID=1763998 RepID=UPI001FC981C3|nr:monofunctional biosynthetic peptidoglycan transglycosylase [Rheinheimera sp. F8]
MFNVCNHLLKLSLNFLFRPLLLLLRYCSLGVLTLVLLFAYLPVPYTGVMLERQLSAWLDGKTQYQARHQWRSLTQISPNLMQAVVAAEDQKFLQHSGFDLQAIEKALVYNSKGRKVRGASTISQQTAKNVFLWTGRSWLRKGLESGLTLLIEGAWGKNRILEVYLNSVEFGPGIFGAEAAAQRYFGVSAARLSRPQAALLAAVLPNPHRFLVQAPSPYVRKRQQWIQKQMQQLTSVHRQLR